MTEETLALLLYTTWSKSDPDKAQKAWGNKQTFIDRHRFRNQARALLPLLNSGHPAALVEAVSAVLWDEGDVYTVSYGNPGNFVPNLGETTGREFVGKLAKLAITAYDSWLAAKAPTDVVALVKDFEDKVNIVRGTGSHWHDEYPQRIADMNTARIALLAAVQRRVVVTDEMVERALGKFTRPTPGNRGPIPSTLIRSMRSALEAALTTEGSDQGERM